MELWRKNMVLIYAIPTLIERKRNTKVRGTSSLEIPFLHDSGSVTSMAIIWAVLINGNGMELFLLVYQCVSSSERLKALMMLGLWSDQRIS